MATPIIRILGLLRQAQKRGKSTCSPYKCVITHDNICVSCYGHVIFKSAIPIKLESIEISGVSQMEINCINTIFYFYDLKYYVSNKYEKSAILRSNGVYIYDRV